MFTVRLSVSVHLYTELIKNGSRLVPFVEISMKRLNLEHFAARFYGGFLAFFTHTESTEISRPSYLNQRF